MNLKKVLALLLVCCMVIGLAACGNKVDPEPAPTPTPDPVPEKTQTEIDAEKAAEVAALIDAIYVQERTDKTDAQCEAAKKAWDALTDAQKELVEGEEASPEYFGLNTGDASKDDPRNQDGIGKNEILVASFGTSFNDSRVADIKAIEDAIAAANPNWSVRRAFTAQIIINHIQARDGEKIDNMQQALDRAVANGVENLVIQPTHLMHGAEYDELVAATEGYKDKFKNIVVAEPLLGPVGKDASVINADKQNVAKALVAAALADIGYKTMADAAKDGVAFVFMGHGTSHNAKVTYSQMQTQMNKLGYKNVFIGTVEGEPEETACEEVIEAVKAAGYKTVVLRPLMVVAGDHANNDMAGDDEDSWKSMFEASKAFDNIECQIAGLGGIADIQKIYTAHTAVAVKTVVNATAGSSDPIVAPPTPQQNPTTPDKPTTASLADGVYKVSVKTDGGMFKLAEGHNGKGLLYVSGGKMTVHIALSGTGYIGVFNGTAENAAKPGANVIDCVSETVKFNDGTTDKVNSFTFNVPSLGTEFDLATVGKKGNWYDHKITVSDAAKIATKAVTPTLTGGTGKTTVKSAETFTDLNGKTMAIVTWSSKSLDWMEVGGEKYYPINPTGECKFAVPVELGTDMAVSVQTSAMSAPHVIEYTLNLQ